MTSTAKMTEHEISSPVHHVLHGVHLVLDAPVEHWPVGDAATAVDPWQVTVELGVTADDLGPQPPTGSVTWTWVDEGDTSTLWLLGGEVPALLNMVVDRRARCIAVRHTLPDAPDVRSDCLDLLHRWVVADLAREATGALPLHAAVVDVAAGAILVLGPSGRGKSSLATAFVALGADVFCDEPACVVRDGDDWLVHAGVRALRVGDENLDVFEQVGRARPVCGVDDVGKSVLPTASADLPLRAPVLAILLLDERRTDGPLVVMGRPSGGATAGRLMTERYARANERGRIVNDFAAVTSLAATAPIYEVSLLDDRSRLVDAARDVLEHLTAGVGAVKSWPG
jgi:hypothetical protein